MVRGNKRLQGEGDSRHEIAALRLKCIVLVPFCLHCNVYVCTLLRVRFIGQQICLWFLSLLLLGSNKYYNTVIPMAPQESGS